MPWYTYKSRPDKGALSGTRYVLIQDKWDTSLNILCISQSAGQGGNYSSMGLLDFYEASQWATPGSFTSKVGMGSTNWDVISSR